MNTPPNNSTSRREFLKSTGRIAAASALAGVALPHVHAAVDDTVQLALVGCGGRGTGAAANAFSTSKLGPVKLVAMADVFQNRLKGSYDGLNKRYSSQMDVPVDRQFIGVDAYQKAMDCLKPGRCDLRHAAGVPLVPSPTPSKKASMSSWKSWSPWTAQRAAGCSSGEESVQKNLKVGSV